MLIKKYFKFLKPILVIAFVSSFSLLKSSYPALGAPIFMPPMLNSPALYDSTGSVATYNEFNNSNVSTEDPSYLNLLLQGMAKDFKDTSMYYGKQISRTLGNVLMSTMAVYIAFYFLANMLKATFNFHEMTITMIKVFIVGYIIKQFGEFQSVILDPIDHIFNYDIPIFFKNGMGSDLQSIYTPITNLLFKYMSWRHIISPEMLGVLLCYAVATILLLLGNYYIMYAQIQFYLNFALLPLFIFLGLFKTTRSVFMGSITICLTSFGTVIVINMFSVLITKVLLRIIQSWAGNNITFNSLIAFAFVGMLSCIFIVKLGGYVQQTFGATLLPPVPNITTLKNTAMSSIRGVRSLLRV